jgi:hypothetical protein
LIRSTSPDINQVRSTIKFSPERQSKQKKKSVLKPTHTRTAKLNVGNEACLGTDAVALAAGPLVLVLALAEEAADAAAVAAPLVEQQRTGVAEWRTGDAGGHQPSLNFR